MHTSFISRHDRHCLNHLIAEAITEPEIQQRLLQHDEQLIIDFALPPSVWEIISGIQSHSLNDFCKQLVLQE